MNLELLTKGRAMLDQRPLISIITVVYNGVIFIEQTIQSVINQKYKNYEYIIIDGGSVDGTLDVIRQYEDSIDYWLSEPDKGIYDAMNKAIELVNGDWVVFLNAGDQFSNNAVLQKVSYYLEKGNADLFVGNYFNVSENTHIEQKTTFFALTTKMICHQSIIYRSLCLKKLPFNTKYKICADFDQLMRFLNDGIMIEKIRLEFVLYHGDGVSIKQTHARLTERLDIIKQHFGFALKFWGIVNNYRQRWKYKRAVRNSTSKNN